MGPYSPYGQKLSPLKKAMGLLGNIMAIGIAFFATGPAHSATVQNIQEFVATTYSTQLAGLAGIIWFLIVAIFIFAISSLATVLLLQIITMWLTKFSFR